ncbi:hypothetical protein RA280_43570 [Cupriavidus sp. CV2]|uniref:hypothetical protein n=1 Tax=Cupriavidus ulmosensis TaxID=3065913 RepID=UPI00296ADF47|nr:hypothetical protein [Cupriavidus sp. CV2]MDW3688488.1 hypothetical protein [Cupriavidus sp. CV2]
MEDQHRETTAMGHLLALLHELHHMEHAMDKNQPERYFLAVRALSSRAREAREFVQNGGKHD